MGGVWVVVKRCRRCKNGEVRCGVVVDVVLWGIVFRRGSR